MVYIYIKLYYLSSYKLYMDMYTLRTAEIDVDTHESGYGSTYCLSEGGA